MTYLTMLFEAFLFVFSNILEIIEEVYLFAESHFDRQRDFEGVDAFIHLAVVSSFKLLCSALFVASLTLWTWCNSPLKRSSRQDLEAERDDALNLIQQLVVRISDLEAISEQTLADRNVILHEYSLLTTEKTVLENKLARLQSQPDLQAKCCDLKTSLERSRAQCLDLEISLERSKRLRRDEDSERNELSQQAKRARSELREVKASLRLKFDWLKAEFDENLARTKKQRDQAQAALPARLAQLRKENKDRNGEVTLLRELLKAQKTELEARLHGQSLRIKQLERDLMSEQRNHQELQKIYKNLADSKQQQDAHGAEPETVMDGELQNEIRELRISLDSKAEAINTYRSQIAELEEEIKAKKAKEAFQKNTGLTRLQNTRDQASPDLHVEAFAANTTKILKSEKVLEAEDTGHDDLEASKLEKLPEQRHQLAEIITPLEEIEDSRDQRRSTAETYRMQHVEAQDIVKAGEGGKQDELVNAVGEPDGKTAGKLEVESEGSKSGSCASMTRQHDGELVNAVGEPDGKTAGKLEVESEGSKSGSCASMTRQHDGELMNAVGEPDGKTAGKLEVESEGSKSGSCASMTRQHDGEQMNAVGEPDGKTAGKLEVETEGSKSESCASMTRQHDGEQVNAVGEPDGKTTGKLEVETEGSKSGSCASRKRQHDEEPDGRPVKIVRHG